MCVLGSCFSSEAMRLCSTFSRQSRSMSLIPVPPMPIDGDVSFVMDTNAFSAVVAGPAGVRGRIVLPRQVFQELRPEGAYSAARNAARLCLPGHECAGSRQRLLSALGRYAEPTVFRVHNAGSMSADMQILLQAEVRRPGLTRFLTLDNVLAVVSALCNELRSVAWPCPEELDAMGMLSVGTSGHVYPSRSLRRLVNPGPRRLVVFDLEGFAAVPEDKLEMCCEAGHVSVCMTLQALVEADQRVKALDFDVRRRLCLLRRSLEEEKLFPVRDAFRRARQRMFSSTNNVDWHIDCATLLCRALSVPTAVIVSNARSLHVAAALENLGGWKTSILAGCSVVCNDAEFDAWWGGE